MKKLSTLLVVSLGCAILFSFNIAQVYAQTTWSSDTVKFNNILTNILRDTLFNPAKANTFTNLRIPLTGKLTLFTDAQGFLTTGTVTPPTGLWGGGDGFPTFTGPTTCYIAFSGTYADGPVYFCFDKAVELWYPTNLGKKAVVSGTGIIQTEDTYGFGYLQAEWLETDDASGLPTSIVLNSGTIEGGTQYSMIDYFLNIINFSAIPLSPAP